jgi:hypothetical protein
VSTDINQNDSIGELYQEYWAIHAKMIDKDHNPLEIAAILVSQALAIYKTILDNDEYNDMVDSISASRGQIQELTPDIGILH